MEVWFTNGEAPFGGLNPLGWWGRVDSCQRVIVQVVVKGPRLTAVNSRILDEIGRVLKCPANQGCAIGLRGPLPRQVAHIRCANINAPQSYRHDG